MNSPSPQAKQNNSCSAFWSKTNRNVSAVSTTEADCHLSRGSAGSAHPLWSRSPTRSSAPNGRHLGRGGTAAAATRDGQTRERGFDSQPDGGAEEDRGGVQAEDGAVAARTTFSVHRSAQGEPH